MDAFSKLVDFYEIINIKGSMHAYVWMQLPEQAGLAVKEFVDRVVEQDVVAESSGQL
ncbi:hypothetical protein [Cytobacillus oceanisediminis]|uniref:hypothetical protein n=1 Tax=Cytobacillus oceanisediminis TaxID=665099 RepID=UPI001C92C5B4|nr:hypothetical protein [Cytobacillus oceanisediminis]